MSDSSVTLVGRAQEARVSLGIWTLVEGAAGGMGWEEAKDVREAGWSYSSSYIQQETLIWCPVNEVVADHADVQPESSASFDRGSPVGN